MNDLARRSKPAAIACVVLTATLASALPVTLKDSNGTKYNVNTQVVPLSALSNASGALTDATFVKPITVTSYFIGFTPWFGFVTTYTVQHQVNVPLKPAFAGFNSLLISGYNGQKLAVPLVYNPGQIATQDCPANGKNQQLTFAAQAFPDQNLSITRKVFVNQNQEWARWLNIVTNTGQTAVPVAISLLGRFGSGSDTIVVNSSSGDSNATAQDLWFTTQQSVPPGGQSFQPRIGYVLQGPGATTPASNAGISVTTSPPGKSAFTYIPTIQPGASAVVMTFVTVQGKNKAAKSTCTSLVANPLPSAAIKCMTQQELSQVVNFAPITPPVPKSSTVQLNFKKQGQDTVQWKGKITIAGGISLAGLPVTVDFGGVTQTFTLNKSGTGNNGGGNKFTLNASLSKGVTKPGTYSFSFNLKGDLQTALAQYGLTNAAADNVSVSIPLAMTAGPGEYATDQGYTYNAKEGKSGTAKTS
jgi:hypothetical protein